MGAEIGGTDSAKSEPNVVPLCDVLLVLLIIFMVVTPMIKGGTNVNLPEAKNTINQPEPGQLLTVYVKKDGKVLLEDLEIADISNLTLKIEEMMLDREGQITEKKVLLKADGDVKYGDLADVMTAIRNAQIEFIGLLTDKKTGSLSD